MLDDEVADHFSIGDMRQFNAAATEALSAIGSIVERGTLEAAPELTAIAQGVRLALAASAAGLGECREETPYTALYPIRENGVLRWCCTHRPPHCSP